MDSKIIEALKANRLPVCYMPAGLREEMFSIDIEEFQCLQSTSKTDHLIWMDVTRVKGCNRSKWDVDENEEATFIYRLKQDYAPEPEILECPVKPPNHANMIWVDTNLLQESNADVQDMDFASCIMHKNFIGFKYEDGSVASYARRYRSGAMTTATICTVADDCIGNYEVLTPTHVLFRNAD